MWRPTELGTIVAERTFDLLRGSKRLGRVRIRFGLPVQQPNPDPGAPWFCPFHVAGAGIDSFRAVAGDDSLQSLLLALELATTTVPSEAHRLRAEAQWLKDEERIIFARHTIALGAENALIALLGRLKQASAILDTGTVAARRARVRAVEALNAIAASASGPVASKKPRRKSRTPRK
jgi:hypothetical protein